MNWRNVRLIFLREVRDQLRDRRTLFMIAVLPLLLYPALGVGVMQMQVLRSEQPRTVVVLNADALPDPPLLDGDRFAAAWFERPAEAKRLNVVTEEALRRTDAERQGELAERLDAAASVEQVHCKFEQFLREHEAAVAAGDEAEARRVAVRMDAAARSRSALFAGSGIQVLIIVPDGMSDRLAEANVRIRDRTASDVTVPTPVVLYNVADQKSLTAHSEVRRVLDRWEEQLLKERLRAANLPESLPSMVEATTVDLAQPQERAASLWSQFFPVLLVLMTMTGAFYPAVDLAAGEKERGTMETLLICPASRAEIVLGKFFTVMLFSIGTALLNLVSIVTTGKYVSSFGEVAGGGRLDFLGPPPLASLLWVAVLMLPLAALFSALCLSLATFARSTKEGQYYLTPLLLVAVGLTIFCLLPTVEISPLYSTLPVVGISLLLKELLAGGGGYGYLAPVLVTSFGYASLALWWAIEQFSREEVLFREAERFELKLWFKQLMRDKGDTPSFAEAGLCFVLIVLLQFGAMRFLAQAAGLDGVGSPQQILRLLMIQQIAIIAAPALLMGAMLTRSMRKTFRLRLPAASYLAVAVALPFALQPICYTLVRSLEWFFPALPESVVEVTRTMGQADVSIWLALLAFAVAPAVCEEIAFRGFLLSGFLHSRRTWLAIGLSSLAFGIMHMIPQQVFNAALVGLVLGLLAVRSGSLWPGVIFHLLFNGSQVLITRMNFESGRWNWLMTPDGDEGVRYSWPVLAISALAAAGMIRWMVLDRRSIPRKDRFDSPSRPMPARVEDVPVAVS